MEFLDHSQTFLGVMLTLNVLCIYVQKRNFVGSVQEDAVDSTESNNFIYNIIQAFRNRFIKDLTLRQVDLSQQHKQIEEDRDYQKIKEICQNPDGYDDSIIDKANILSFEYSTQLNRIKMGLTSDYAKVFARVDRSTEQFRAPLFSLGYGILIFLIDELCRVFTGEKFLFIAESVGWYLTWLSSIYWFIIWSFFLSKPRKQPHDTLSRGSTFDFIDKVFGTMDGTALKLLLCWGIYFLTLFLIPFSKNCNCRWESLIIAAGIIPISIIGLCREIKCPIRGNYSFMHILGHLGGFSLFALGLSFIGANYYYASLSHLPIFSLSGMPALRLCIVLFALLNGILAPFALPYIKYSSLYHEEQHKLETQLETANKLNDRFKKSFKQFCEQVGRQHLHLTP